jgi:hypothetical protein
MKGHRAVKMSVYFFIKRTVFRDGICDAWSKSSIKNGNTSSSKCLEQSKDTEDSRENHQSPRKDLHII